MSSQLRVGVFAVCTVLAIFVVWYVLSNYALRRHAYVIGVHFRNVAGLAIGSSVQLSGVDIGIVQDIKLLPDQTVDVIATINGNHTVYRQSAFTVTTTLTGQSTLAITPPRDLATATPLPHQVLPEDQQPEGTLPPSLTDLANEGQQRLHDLDKTLAVVNQELPVIARRFNGVVTHTDDLVVHADASLALVQGQLSATVGQVNGLLSATQGVLTESGRNVNQLTGSMRGLVVNNQERISRLIENLASTADSLNKTMASVSSLAGDPTVRTNLVQTTTNIKDSSEKLKEIANDIHSLTGDPQVQSQLRGAVQDLSSVIAKADDLLGTFSSAQAHGPTQGATSRPGPPGSASPAPEGSAGPQPQQPGQPQSGPTGSPKPDRRLNSALAGLLGHGAGRGSPWAQAQLRETWNTQGGGGPASDLNLVILPRLGTHVSLGANDIGYNTTYNALLETTASPRLQYGVGVLYSNVGAKTLYKFNGPLALDARLYDPRHPKLDLYGDFRLTQRLQLFYGERSLIGPANKTPAFGFQLDY